MSLIIWKHLIKENINILIAFDIKIKLVSE